MSFVFFFFQPDTSPIPPEKESKWERYVPAKAKEIQAVQAVVAPGPAPPPKNAPPAAAAPAAPAECKSNVPFL